MKRKRGRPKQHLVNTPEALLQTGTGCSNVNENDFDNFENADEFEEFTEKPESPEQADSDMNVGGLEEGIEKLINQIAEDNVKSLRKAFSEMISNRIGGTSKLSRDFSSSRRRNTNTSKAVAMQDERTHQEEPILSHQDCQYKEKELNDCLAVIKRIMKMDAAAPFNIPVNSVALGIPDYTDIVDKPMDFGTICNNLEKGLKYKNSKDVFKDVECIWENCFKYNKKGDYILELAKRVKANFLKHWAATGFYTRVQQPETTNGQGYSHAPPPHSDSAVRHAKWMEGCLMGSASEYPTHHHMTTPEHRDLTQEIHSPRQPSPNFSPPRESSDEQQPSEEAHTDDAIVNTTEIGSSSGKRRRGRGPTRCLKVWNTVGRIHIVTNEIGQPVGDDAPKLSNFLGTMARDGLLAPLTYSDWRAMPDSNKEKMWQQVELKFDIDPKSRGWVLDSVAKKWRSWKCMLKANHYSTHTTDEERLADRDERVLPDQWEYLISYWNSEEGEKRSAINKEIRARQKFNHVTGTKSFARIREEEKEKRPDGKEPTWAELFIMTRTRKDGNPVNEASSTLISQLRECGTQQQQETSENGMTPQDKILSQLTGNGRSDRLLTYGIDAGSASASVLGRKPTRVEAIRMVSEANAEVHDMKERMAAMEQTCAQMAEQMAKMMSMMSSMHSTVPTTNNAPISVDFGTSPIPEGVPVHQVRSPISEHVKSQSRETRATKRNKHTASTSAMNSKTK